MSMGFDDNIIEEIKYRCNIVEVIGRYVPLKKLGGNFTGLCPFHNEKTPSFMVSETKQIFTCFGCGAKGDVIEFIKRYHNLEFSEAIEKLAGEYHIEIKHTASKDGYKKELLEINREAAAFFYRAFKIKGNPALSYMERRGIDEETLRKFGIGYADEQWSSLYDYFQEKGTDPKRLVELGLVTLSKGKYYDRFRSRVIFPIINTRGMVVGFGGRALSDQDNPKYLNSPETPIFQKKNNLYGLNLTRQDIIKENAAILVEGYMDVISLYRQGVRNVTASLGTALTDNQGMMLKRYTENTIIAYDMDDAGQAAALRGVDILHNAGCKASVLRLSQGKDPDEFMKNHTKEDFYGLIKEALPFMDYKISLLKKKHDLQTAEGSVAFLKEAAAMLATLSPIEADIYVQKIAKESKISAGAIKLEINGNHKIKHSFASNLSQDKRSSLREEKEAKGISALERYFIKLMLVKSSYVPRVKEYENVFASSTGQAIYQEILNQFQPLEEIDIIQLEECLDSHGLKVLNHIMENVHLSDKEEQIFEECVKKYKSKELRMREREIIDFLAAFGGEETVDQLNIQRLYEELKEIQMQLQEHKK